MRRRAGLFLSVTAVAALAIFTPIRSTAAEGGQMDVSGHAVQEAIRIRHELGLRADSAYVDDTFGRTADFPVRDFNGVPLSVAEAAELERRIEVQQSVAEAREWASRQPGYAGGYTDQTLGGTPVFSFRGDAAAIRAGLETRIPAGVPFRIESVPRSMDDLLKIKADVRASWDRLERQGIDILNVGIDTKGNTVTVGVVGLTPGEESDLKASLPTGVAIRDQQPAVLDACNSRIDCGAPLKGGLRITPSGLSGYCTSAYIAELNNYTPANLRVVTAGHCIELKGGVGREWRHNGVGFGTASVETWASGADGDVGAIRVAIPATQAMNLFYASSASDIRAFTSFAVLSEVQVDDFFCRSGATTGYVCGRVVDVDGSLQVEGRIIDHQTMVDFDASPGDSGGPYWFGNRLYGIHSDSTDNSAPGTHYAWYTPYVWAATVVSNVDICLDSNC